MSRQCERMSLVVWHDTHDVYRMRLWIVVSEEAGVVRLRSWLELYTQYEVAARNTTCSLHASSTECRWCRPRLGSSWTWCNMIV